MSEMVSRDPFAREELHRERVKEITNTCTWCGDVNHTPKKKTPYLFRYWVERDDQNGRRDHIKGLFCSTSCFKSYNNIE